MNEDAAARKERDRYRSLFCYIAGGKRLDQAIPLAFPDITYDTIHRRMRRNENLWKLYKDACSQRRDRKKEAIRKYKRDWAFNDYWKTGRKKEYDKNRYSVIRGDSRYIEFKQMMRYAYEERAEKGGEIKDIKARLGIPSGWKWVGVDYSAHEIPEKSSGVMHVWDGDRLVPRFHD